MENKEDTGISSALRELIGALIQLLINLLKEIFKYLFSTVFQKVGNKKQYQKWKMRGLSSESARIADAHERILRNNKMKGFKDDGSKYWSRTPKN